MAGTTDALTVTFPEPMDHALALRMIRVADHTGATVEGTASLADHEDALDVHTKVSVAARPP